MHKLQTCSFFVCVSLGKDDLDTLVTLNNSTYQHQSRLNMRSTLWNAFRFYFQAKFVSKKVWEEINMESLRANYFLFVVNDIIRAKWQMYCSYLTVKSLPVKDRTDVCNSHCLTLPLELPSSLRAEIMAWIETIIYVVILCDFHLSKRKSSSLMSNQYECCNICLHVLWDILHNCSELSKY